MSLPNEALKPDSCSQHQHTYNTTYTEYSIIPTTHTASPSILSHTLQPTSTFQPISDTPFSLFIKHNGPSFYNTSHLSFPHFTHYHKAFHRLTFALFFHQSNAHHEHTSILTTALNIAVIQDTAAKIILFLMPPFVPIEILHRSICMSLLKNTSPSSFRTAHTSRNITRSLLGRFF